MNYNTVQWVFTFLWFNHIIYLLKKVKWIYINIIQFKNHNELS